jgi:C-terminal processing protease CtpA/Prc
LALKIEAEYFDQALGAKVAAGLREASAHGRYANVLDLEGLATLVTSDLYTLAKDRHLSLQTVKVLPPQPSQGPAFKEETREERGKHENFGFQKMEVLPGNVGYLRVTAFYRPEETRGTIAEAMAFLSHADALIVDLRDHGGGATPTVALFTSYFLADPDMPLFAITPRLPAAPRPYLTEPKSLANRNATRPTFLLTSPETCSGGEGVAFLLQERHRAVVIGESTWGGANQVPNPRPITQGLQAFIPNGRMGSSLTGRSWEGGGVIPDVPVASGRAVRVAHAMALKALRETAPEGAWRENLQKELARVDPQAEPAKP